MPFARQSLAGLALLAAACSFDATGQGSRGGDGNDTGTTAETGDSSVSGVETSDGSANTTVVDTTDTTSSTTTSGGPTTTTDSTTSGAESGDPSTGTSTGKNQQCDQQFVKVISLVENAVVEDPMVKAMSNQGEGIVAYSEVSEQGVLRFSVEMPCADVFYLWARAFDAAPGINNYDPDSYYVSVDGGPEDGWFYGCQSFDDPAGWGWHVVDANMAGAQCNEAQDLDLDFNSGTHVIELRNREPMNILGDVAIVARILVTNDPGYTPTVQD